MNTKLPKKFNNTILKSLPFLFNYGALSYIFILLNLVGEHALSVNLSIFQAIIFLFTASFSGDFRSMFLGNNNFYYILIKYRIIAILAFLIIAFFSMPFIDKSYHLIFSLLALRRFLDWIEEILLLRSTKKNLVFIYSSTQLLFLIPSPFIIIYIKSWLFIYMAFWIFSTSIIFIKEYKIIFMEFLNKKLFIANTFINQPNLHRQIYATIFIAIGNFILRYSINQFHNIESASAIISSFSIGGIAGSLISNTFIPNFLVYFKNIGSNRSSLMWYVFLQALITIFILYFNLGRNYIESLNLDFYTLILSFLGGNIAILANFKRFYLLQIKKVTSEREDLIINLFLLIVIFILLHQLKHYYESITLITSIFSFAIFSFRKDLVLNNKNIIFSWLLFYLLVLIFFPFFIFYMLF